MKVELRTHAGQSRRRGKLMPATVTRQFRVFLEGQHVGYVTNRPGASFRPIFTASHFAPEERTAIDNEITNTIGKPEQTINLPSSIDPDEDELDEAVEQLDSVGDIDDVLDAS